ncbi:MAG: hypothetical protein LBB50_06980, partial [Oscillospiraceae bacterium]|nr:hypothetical protein [Oscillospiraceae bacterium]
MPPALRKQMQAAWGASPELLCFGAQFFYLCPADQAETLLHRVDAQLCLAFAQTLWQVTDYLRDMTHLVEPIVPTSAGRFVLPREVMERLQVPNGGVLRLLGVGSHWE